MGYHVTHQPFISGTVFPHDDHTFFNPGVFGQGCFHFPQFNAEAPHFHLVVDASQKFDVPIR